jgi:hemoglobin
VPLTKPHFKQWEKLFTETVDELFDGDNAILAKQRALSISTLMQVKIITAPQ